MLFSSLRLLSIVGGVASVSFNNFVAKVIKYY